MTGQGNYHTTGRRTGRTFRKLLISLAWASEGKRVIYMTGDGGSAYWYMNQAKKIADAYLTQDTIEISQDKTTITFKKSSGKIHFVHPSTLKGEHGEIIYDD